MDLQLSDKTALVTGSTGFLGRHLVQRLLASGWRVRALLRDPKKAGLLSGTAAELAYGNLTAPGSLTADLQVHMLDPGGSRGRGGCSPRPRFVVGR